MTAYLLGCLTGAVLAVVALVLLAWLDDRPHRASARRVREQRERQAWRDWCERCGWCPAHNTADGSCPRVEVKYPTWTGPRFVPCPGSGVLREQRPERQGGLVFDYTTGDDMRAGAR